MRALVTGGYGFIGSHLVDLLHSNNWEITVFDRYRNPYYKLPRGVNYINAELNNRGALRKALEGVGVVYHLAWSGVHQTSNMDLRGHVENNLLPSLGLFEICREIGIGKIVFISSGGTVYGKIRRLPTSEDHPNNPVSAYGVTKLSIEKYLELHGFLHNQDYVILRPSVPYGERQNPFGIQGAVNVFMGRILQGKPIEIWGDGKVERDFFYVGDMAGALYRVGAPDVKNEVFNIGGGESVSLNRLVDKLRKITQRNFTVQYLQGRAFDVPRVQLDISKAESQLGWRPRVELEDGLERTWQWIKSCSA